MASRRRLALLALLLAVSTPGLAGARPPPAAPAPPPAPVPDAPRARVQVPVGDGVTLVGTYARNGAAPGGPALLLVHGEEGTRSSFEPLLDSLDEDRVPWLSVDLRGFGDSRVQEGKDLGPLVASGDAGLHEALADDVWAAVRFLAEAKGHDPARVGILASGLGASAAVRAARLHKGGVAALMLLTPAATYAGLDTVADVADQQGAMDLWILASVEDMNRLDKKGPRHLLYVAEAARNAPKDTPLEERILKRRGIPPRLRAFAETKVTGTRMITGVAHLDEWLAAWWARRLSTYPHPVLYDGSVDVKGDYADPEWAAGADLPGGGDLHARALRWGQRVMVGGELPDDVRTIYLRIQATRGPGEQAGQYARISFPQGVVEVQRLMRLGLGRSLGIETSALVLEGEELPQPDGSMQYGKPSFEAELRLPELPGDGPTLVRMSFAVGRASGATSAAPGVDPERSETWTLVPDLLAGAPPPAAPPPPPDGTTPAPGPRGLPGR